MTKPKLYLFVGYPGAGKTTLAKIIEEATGATHLWADQERQKMFDQSTHSAQESRELYEHLNDQTKQLLLAGSSVIFDTNFNFRADRDYLRHIASECQAETVLIWINTPLEVASRRALDSELLRNGYNEPMSRQRFDSIVCKLEPPTKDENPLKFDGTKFDSDALKRHFSSYV